MGNYCIVALFGESETSLAVGPFNWVYSINLKPTLGAVLCFMAFLIEPKPFQMLQMLVNSAFDTITMRCRSQRSHRSNRVWKARCAMGSGISAVQKATAEATAQSVKTRRKHGRQIMPTKNYKATILFVALWSRRRYRKESQFLNGTARCSC